MHILYVFPQDVTTLEVRSTLYEIMPPDHEHLMSIRLNGTLHEAILNSRTQQAAFSGVKATNLETLWRFGRLGVEHIFTGYDHLAFLLGLLVATATLGSLVKIITSFTIAHSITLALATFNVVVLPSRLTESLIALSIGYVAAENLFDFRVMKRYYITFLFGLIHGFGFSTVLREMDLPQLKPRPLAFLLQRRSRDRTDHIRAADFPAGAGSGVFGLEKTQARGIGRNRVSRRILVRAACVSKLTLLGNQLQHHPGIGSNPEMILIRPRNHRAVRYGPVIHLHLAPLLEVVARQYLQFPRNRAAIDGPRCLIARKDPAIRSRESPHVRNSTVFRFKCTHALARVHVDQISLARNFKRVLVFRQSERRTLRRHADARHLAETPRPRSSSRSCRR